MNLRPPSFFDWFRNRASQIPKKILPVKDLNCQKLVINSKDWRLSRDIDEEFDVDCASRVYFINQMLKSRNVRTRITDKTIRSHCHFPDGLHVLHRLNLSEEVYRTAVSELRRLFLGEDSNPTRLATLRGQERSKGSGSNLTILFLAKEPSLEFLEVMEFLFEHYRPLAEFVLIYALAYMRLLGGSLRDLYSCSLTFVRYKPNTGLKPHIDGVKDFGNSFGPIFTLAMGEGVKRLDMLPTILDAPVSQFPPVRVFTKQFQTVLMQGPARAEYTHGVPFGNSSEHMTIAFKFGAIQATHLELREHENEVLKSIFYSIRI